MSDEEKKEAPEEVCLPDPGDDAEESSVLATTKGGATWVSGTSISTSAFPTTSPSWYPSGTITTGTGMTGVVSPPAASYPSIKKVSLPSKVTDKILIAFLDPDEEDETKNVVWAKILHVDHVDIEVPMTPGDKPTMAIDLSLDDRYGNEDEES